MEECREPFHYPCPICDQLTLNEDPLGPCSTHEICPDCHYQSGYHDGGGTLAQRQQHFTRLREKYQRTGRA